MTAYTSSQSGNWSSAATWGGSGVPGDGDTASIGAHTVTVDVNTTVGTSPNDNTTKVLDRTHASAKLLIATGVTLTVKGNIGGVNACTLEMQAGSSLVFDASGSGGTPVYKFINVGGDKLVMSGTSGSRCSITAAEGYTWALGAATAFNGVTYSDFSRCSTWTVTNAALNSTSGTIITNSTWDECGTVEISQNSSSLNFTFNDNVVSNTTATTYGAKMILGTAASSGTREFHRNVIDKCFANNAKSLSIRDNVLGGYESSATIASYAHTPTNNYIDNTINTNGGNGMLMNGSWDGLYITSSVASGNPHFIAPKCTDGSVETYSRVIFESQSPDLVDTGDCFLGIGAFCSTGMKLRLRNCIVLRSPLTGVMSGQLITSYNPGSDNSQHNFDISNCTLNVNKSAVGGIGARAAIAFAEAAAGAADQISSLKSNLVWATATGNGYIAERISGTVDGHITAANADYNWRWNVDDGDNGRGYEDRANSPGQDLWDTGNADGGDAAAAGVDDNQGSGDPEFYDSSRCIATWCAARGYGASTFSAGVAALKADPTRVADLINYVFEGFRISASSSRTAGHHGHQVGAANWYKSRSMDRFSAFRLKINNTFSVAV